MTLLPRQIGDIKTDALVPYADMLNHYRPRETKWTFDNDKGAFTITSLAQLRAGQQVYDSYGKKCNSRFLINYGFAVENNRDPDGQCHNEVRRLDREKRACAQLWWCGWAGATGVLSVTFL